VLKGDAMAAVSKLKQETGGDILVAGSRALELTIFGGPIARERTIQYADWRYRLAARAHPMKSEPGPTLTFGGSSCRLRLIVWCRDCSRQLDPVFGRLADAIWIWW
jgi:hypothetical protein